ncbi:hypothetical protein MKW92_039828 [Papaver armeniacum]|nr:hypothetical protein MKW92_039828 [Papaver armeniacum]
MSYEFHTSNGCSIHVLPFSLSNVVRVIFYFVLETSNGIIKTRFLNLLRVQDLSSLIHVIYVKQTAITIWLRDSKLIRQLQPPQKGEDIIACVESLEAALLPCLSQRDYEVLCSKLMVTFVLIVDVERHARDFMEAAKKLQLYFIDLQHEELPTERSNSLKDIAEMEEEIRTKKQSIKKHAKLILGWRKS